MNYSKVRSELKPRLQEYVESITQKSKGANMYVCPLCGSGTGTNHTGAFSIDSKDRTRWKCFSCGKSGDIFDLIGEVEHIEEPVAQLKRAGELYGVRIEDQNQPKSEQYTHTDMCIHTNTYTHTDTAKADYSDYFRECHTRLQDTDYLAKRGISERVANLFNIGYDAHYTKSTGGREWQALIIPTGKESYNARNTDPEADSKNRYRKTGGAIPLNMEALSKATQPIFITEGELDAMSIIEVGGEAIALGSTSDVDLFTNAIEKYIADRTPAQPLVLALDNDEAGRKAEDKLGEKLSKLDITNYRLDIYGDHKDANEALLADKEDFTQQVVQAVAYVREREEEVREEYEKNSAGEHLQEFINGIAKSANTPAIPTGFTNLDEALDGGLYEGLYIIGAITSLGKTTLALQIADQIADSGQDVLIFSLEMARSELMSKSISRLTLLDTLDNGGDIRNAKTNRGITAGARWGNYSDQEKDLIYRAMNTYGKYAKHIYIKEGIGDIGVDDIRKAIEKHRKITGQAPVVIVDYVQILAPYNYRATDKQNIDKAVLELKRISRDNKIPVIGISSFNRTSYNGEVAEEAFKESGSLEYGCDVLIGLQLKGAGSKDFKSKEAKQRNPRQVELIVLKNRNGKTGSKIDYEYYPLFNYFKEV